MFLPINQKKTKKELKELKCVYLSSNCLIAVLNYKY